MFKYYYNFYYNNAISNYKVLCIFIMIPPPPPQLNPSSDTDFEIPPTLLQDVHVYCKSTISLRNCMLYGWKTKQKQAKLRPFNILDKLTNLAVLTWWN